VLRPDRERARGNAGTYEYLSHQPRLRVSDLPKTPLKKGQITRHGVLLVDSTTHTRFEKPNKYAVTGGTDAYAKTRGEVIELANPTEDRELRIEL
jgi:hypothetical protein